MCSLKRLSNASYCLRVVRVCAPDWPLSLKQKLECSELYASCQHVSFCCAFGFAMKSYFNGRKKYSGCHYRSEFVYFSQHSLPTFSVHLFDSSSLGSVFKRRYVYYCLVFTIDVYFGQNTLISRARTLETLRCWQLSLYTPRH